jgi:hypothetical protein
MKKINDPLLRALKSHMESGIGASDEIDILPDDMSNYLNDGSDMISEEPGETRSPFSDPEREYMMQAIEAMKRDGMAPGGLGAPIEELPSLPSKTPSIGFDPQGISGTVGEHINNMFPLGKSKRTTEDIEPASSLGQEYKRYQKERQQKRKFKKEKK